LAHPPTLKSVHQGALLSFGVDTDFAFSLAGTEEEPELWKEGTEWLAELDGTYDTGAETTLFIRTKNEECSESVAFSHQYQIVETYEPAAEVKGSGAIANDDPRILRWATAWVEPVEWGPEASEMWRKPEQTLGYAEGSSVTVASLGQGGSIILSFDSLIADGPGPDFAVFENAYADTFIELAFVEVSSDGENFLRFDSAYLGTEPMDSYDHQETELIGALAGKYRAGFGTPFDLSLLRTKQAVLDGSVDLLAIRYVRVVDIVGDGQTLDSFGKPIYDPWPTMDSAGFDLDGVAVLNGLPL
ncbi:hypothetical protein KAI87_10625, partial [Myxococcota bacterium]|nr:hypothetical protein [Myxococcota bacterium]